MPQRYVDAIVRSLAGREYQPLRPKQLARQLGVAEKDYGTFREAVKRLRDAGRIVLGARDALTLPEMPRRVTGEYRANPKGFGFIVPEMPNAHGDLYIPAGADGGAVTGDRVLARVRKGGRRRGELVFNGEIVQILERGQNRFVGTLQQAERTWFLLPDGRQLNRPVVIRDVGAAKAGEKIVVEIVQYAEPGQLPSGVIVERLGKAGPLAVETRAVIRARGLSEEFPPAALADARAAVAAFDPHDATGRKDITSQTVVTIDPDESGDFDDAISITRSRGGAAVLGVHIADVSHFVAEGTALDEEAHRRGTSVYFPKTVLPMLPKILANGVCSLQQGQRRYCKSVFITYDTEGNVLGARAAETVLRSTCRLTYRQAQLICDGKTGGFDPKVVRLVRSMESLARTIEARRRKAGMLHLDLPAVELLFDKDDNVVDAKPEDDAYTHTIIEMFMVEANEAVARMLDRENCPFLRRIHPAPDPAATGQLAGFVRAAGHKIPRDLTRQDMQQLVEAVRGRPQSYAVNLALLKTFQQAEYSPMHIGHYALGSSQYCHFTSPIRRYADLTVHRQITRLCRSQPLEGSPDDTAALVELGRHCSAADRRAESAERELREVLILQLLAKRVGESFDGVITGVTNFGLFVQSPRFLIEGLLRMEDLGDDWWELSARYGQIRGERSGKVYRIGDVLAVRIAGVDLAKRQLHIALDTPPPPSGRKSARKKPAPNKPAQDKPGQKKPAQEKSAQKKPPPPKGRRKRGKKGT